MQREVKEVIKEVSKELGVPEEIVRAVIDSQYQYTKLSMTQGDPDDEESFLNIRHIHLGLFVVKPYKVRAINKAKALRNEGNL